jgi:hypothetical protein
VYTHFETIFDELITSELNSIDWDTVKVRYYSRRFDNWSPLPLHRICVATVELKLWGWYNLTLVGWANWSPRQMCRVTRVVDLPDGSQKTVHHQKPVPYNYQEGCNIALRNLRSQTDNRFFIVRPGLCEVKDYTDSTPETAGMIGVLESGGQSYDLLANPAYDYTWHYRGSLIDTITYRIMTESYYTTDTED